MEVALQGSSPAATTAGIMLLTRARQLGYRLDVAVVGDPARIERVPGPAVVYAPVLASCGVGRDHGQGATVVVPGPPGQPILATVQPHGVGGWFLVDRSGEGSHPATQALLRLTRDSRAEARDLAKTMRRAIDVLGMSNDPAVLDILFGAPVPPLLRLAVALRAGRALSGGRGQPITRYLAGDVPVADPLPDDTPDEVVLAHLRDGELQWVFDRLSTALQDAAEAWCQTALRLAEGDGGRDLALLRALVDLASHLAQLPRHSILPPLGAAEDSVAVGLRAALTAEGDGDANLQLGQVFRFLGGRYVDHAEHVLAVSATEPPAELVERWQWFCAEVRIGRKQSDALWPEIIDPPQ